MAISAKSATSSQPSISAHQSADFFVMRTPALSQQLYYQWGANLSVTSLDTDATALPEALAADRACLREGLRNWLARAETREAIFLASPDLDEFLESWERDPDSKKGRRIEEALVRYFARMTNRATPFGLFAGISMGKIGDTTRLSVASQTQRHTRLDMDYLFALLDALTQDQRLSQHLRYRTNSSLYRAAGQVRYLEARVRGKARNYYLVGVELDEALTTVLELAGHGALRGDLAAKLVNDEISMAEAENYIAQLIEDQLLVPEFALPVTGAEPLNQILNQLAVILPDSKVTKTLTEVAGELKQMDVQGPGIEPARYRAIADKLSALPVQADLPRLFQVDLIRNAASAELGQPVLEEIGRSVALLHGLSGAQRKDDLSRFREAFSARYESREVPLVEALDNELGIGFPAGNANANVMPPLLRNLPFPTGKSVSRELETRDNFLLRRLAKIWQNGDHVMELTEQDVQALQIAEPLPLPDAFEVCGTLAAESEAALAAGAFQFHPQYIGGPSGARMIGRFCHADDGLTQAVREHLRAEEASQPDKVFFEITHLPEGRIGNILSRPVLREYEIAYLGASGAPPERQLPITDLLLSESDGRLILRSRQLDCEVLPRLTCAHNWRRESSPLYNFLCEMQEQNLAVDLGWRWGAMESAPFLPRVTYGRLVLAKARWLFQQSDFDFLKQAQDAELFRLMRRWRMNHKLPRWVVLSDFDNTLPLDLENILCLESFARLVKGRESIVLQEFWPAPEQACAQGPDGAYAHELVVPFVRKPFAETTTAKEDGFNSQSDIVQIARQVPVIRRRFAPGSEWLYAKIYCGPAEVDRVLRDIVGPLARRVLNEGLADRWFFVRYGDPDWHLRVRFHGRPQDLMGEICPMLYAELHDSLANGAIRRLQLDTYEPELERYGGMEGLTLTEQLFHVDSEAVIEILESGIGGETGSDARFRLALCGMNRLLTDLGFDLPVRTNVFKWARRNFLREFQADDRLHAELSARYRQERKQISDLLSPVWREDHPLAGGLSALARRSERMKPIAAELRAAWENGRLAHSLPDLSFSYLHMHANHLLRIRQRAQEMVLYDWLARWHISQQERESQLSKS